MGGGKREESYITMSQSSLPARFRNMSHYTEGTSSPSHQVNSYHVPGTVPSAEKNKTKQKSRAELGRHPAFKEFF